MTAFKNLDMDETGHLSKKDLSKAFSKSGKELEDQELRVIFDIDDLNQDGFIDFDEFKSIIDK